MNKIVKFAMAPALLATVLMAGGCKQKPMTSEDMLNQKDVTEMTNQELNQFEKLRFEENCKFFGIDPNAPDAMEQLYIKSKGQRDSVIIKLDSINQALKGFLNKDAFLDKINRVDTCSK